MKTKAASPMSPGASTTLVEEMGRMELMREVERLREQLTLQSDAYAICQNERGHFLRALRDARNALVALQQRRDFGITRNAIAKIDRVLG